MAHGGRDSWVPRNGRTLRALGWTRESYTVASLQLGGEQARLVGVSAVQGSALCEPSGLPGFLPIQKTLPPSPHPRQLCWGRPEARAGGAGFSRRQTIKEHIGCGQLLSGRTRWRPLEVGATQGPERTPDPVGPERRKQAEPLVTMQGRGLSAHGGLELGPGAPASPHSSARLSPPGYNLKRLFSPRPGLGLWPWSCVCLG